MGKSELRNVEPADERAVAADEEFEILSFFLSLFCFSEGFLTEASRAMHEKIFFFFSLTNDSQINLITEKVPRHCR